jgi:hypothetical protein
VAKRSVARAVSARRPALRITDQPLLSARPAVVLRRFDSGYVEERLTDLNGCCQNRPDSWLHGMVQPAEGMSITRAPPRAFSTAD